MPARRQKVVGVAIVSLVLLTVVIVPFPSDRIVSPTTGEKRNRERRLSCALPVACMSQQTAGGVEGEPLLSDGEFIPQT